MFGGVAALFKITWRSKQKPSRILNSEYLEGLVLFERKLLRKKIDSIFTGNAFIPCMSAYGYGFHSAFCDNYSRTTLKICHGYHTMQITVGYRYIWQN